ncbi:MAG TPA: serine/threonine-protein kinase, partial [Vicinamibacteria bacterium]|nr:serine/threonine-protein kinase [Vicinamibacteria bacterium]
PLRAEVESLLSAHASARGFLDGEATGPAPAAPAEAMVGRRLGPYRLVGLIGRGGMGEVCLAVRDDDQFQKLVAVKLIRRGLDDASMQIRFRAERQILARLEHPGIARLIDAGATEEGWPFFVMEHVEGQRIDAYADAARLDIRARLALFRSVCAAVQYAHQNLVVHRDIKPANILVTSDGQPKLLDFGVAKLLGPEAAGQTTSTAFGPLTPAYASPEQILGQPVSTATDVYSLGVLLYELLTGRSPYDAPSGRPMELLTAVVEQEPQGSGLHGDLDDVLMMALRKEPSRRYPSVEAFSEDVRRYLAGLPVAARKGTWSYRTGKFIRRNRLPLAAVAAVLALGAALAVSTAVQARRVARERDKAERVSEFLVGLFTVADPRRPPDTALTAREMLDQGAARIESELAGEPEVQAALMYTMGRVYWRLGVYDQAVLLLEKSLSTRRRVLGRDHRDVAASLQTLGNVLVNKGDHAAAEPMLAEALAIRRRMRPVDPLELAGSLTALGNLLNDRGEFRGAEPLYREALDLRRGALGGQHMQVARSLNNMALVRENLGDYAEAEALHREALAMRRALLGADHPEVARSLNNLGSVLLRKGDVAGAEAALREALASKRRLLGDGHPDVAHSANNLANVLLRRPDYAGAEALYREALAIHRQRLGNEHPEIALFLMNIARALRGKGDAAGSESLHREALAMSRRLLGNGHPNVASSLSNLADLLCERGRAREGESMLREALEILRKTVPAGHPHIAEAEKNLAACGTAPTVGAAAARRP